MVDAANLENWNAAKNCIVGSNPTVSANFLKPFKPL